MTKWNIGDAVRMAEPVEYRYGDEYWLDAEGQPDSYRSWRGAFRQRMIGKVVRLIITRDGSIKEVFVLWENGEENCDLHPLSLVRAAPTVVPVHHRGEEYD